MKITQFLFSFSLFFCLGNFANAQFHQSVFSDLEGTDLLDATVDAYKPSIVLGYGPARDTMYATIYNERDSLKGIYTNHTVFVEPGVDPSVSVFMGGSDNGINAEHTYPQSKGARNGNAKSDMHHLFPSKTPVNADRGSLEFKEIPDAQTSIWYYKATERSSIPSSNIDLYSEGNSGGFEPAEAKKGNIARAMFYFYTMYKSEADSADPNFFENQRETLCNWHYLDPVDSLEWARSFMIAKHQDDKPNPFVLDCSVASRSYCEGIADLCHDLNSVDPNNPDAQFNFNTYPNPTWGEIFLEFTLRKRSDVKISFFNSFGSKISESMTYELGKGNHRIQQMISEQGFHFVEIKIQNQDGFQILKKKVLVAGR